MAFAAAVVSWTRKTLKLLDRREKIKLEVKNISEHLLEKLISFLRFIEPPTRQQNFENAKIVHHEISESDRNSSKYDRIYKDAHKKFSDAQMTKLESLTIVDINWSIKNMKLYTHDEESEEFNQAHSHARVSLFARLNVIACASADQRCGGLNSAPNERRSALKCQDSINHLFGRMIATLWSTQTKCVYNTREIFNEENSILHNTKNSSHRRRRRCLNWRVTNSIKISRSFSSSNKIITPNSTGTEFTHEINFFGRTSDENRLIYWCSLI